MEYKKQVVFLRHPGHLMNSAPCHPRQHWCSENASQAFLRLKKNVLTEGWRVNRDRCRRSGWMSGWRRAIRFELGIEEVDRQDLIRQEMLKLGWDVKVDDRLVNNVVGRLSETGSDESKGSDALFDDSIIDERRHPFYDLTNHAGQASPSESSADSGYVSGEDVDCNHPDMAVDESEVSRPCISHKPSQTGPPFFVRSEAPAKLALKDDTSQFSYTSFDWAEYVEATKGTVEPPGRPLPPQMDSKSQIDPAQQTLGCCLIGEASRLLQSPNYCFWPLVPSLLAYDEHVELASNSQIPSLVVTSPEGSLSTLTECYNIFSSEQCVAITARRDEQILARRMEHNRQHWDLYARAKVEGASQVEYCSMKIARGWWHLAQRKWDKEFSRMEEERQKAAATEDMRIVGETAVAASCQEMADQARRNFDDDPNKEKGFGYNDGGTMVDLVEIARRVIDSLPYDDNNDDKEPTTMYEKVTKDLHDANQTVNLFLDTLEQETESRITEAIRQEARTDSHTGPPYALASLLRRMAATNMITHDDCAIEAGQTFSDKGKTLIFIKPRLSPDKIKYQERTLVTAGRHSVVFTDRVAAVIRDRFEDICAEWQELKAEQELKKKQRTVRRENF